MSADSSSEPPADTAPPAEPLPTPPRQVSAGELEQGLELELERVHKLQIDPGFTFSA